MADAALSMLRKSSKSIPAGELTLSKSPHVGSEAYLGCPYRRVTEARSVVAGQTRELEGVTGRSATLAAAPGAGSGTKERQRCVSLSMGQVRTEDQGKTGLLM